MRRSKNNKTLVDFIAYCQTHPEERFWQALRNWSGHKFVYVADASVPEYQVGTDLTDTFYWTGKDA